MLRGLLRHVGYFAAYGLLGLILALVGALVALYASRLDALPDLQVWHTARLDAEFTAADAGRIRTLADYRALEDRLFAQLKSEVYGRVRPQDQRRFNRYSPGSLSDPFARTPHWNRTFELGTDGSHGAVLLLHGLTDSPYAMRPLAERLRARGLLVVSLRLPGHGTAPAALVDAEWQDWAAAVRLAARDLAGRIGPQGKLYMAGYSTGAALAVEYALARLQGEDLPPVEKLILLSPAIGVSPAAALAVWQARMAVWLGVPKLAWVDVLPEYDPYKYSSFPVNAADQIYAGTRIIARRLDELGRNGHVAGMPRILAFQSVADDTVSTPAVINTLFRRLAADGHELVLFDINRASDHAALYLPGAPEVTANLLQGPALPFGLTVLANASAESLDIVATHRKAGSTESTGGPTGLKWPDGLFSLSHVALPFPPDDPLYGARAPGRHSTMIYLGRPQLRGERGVLAVSPAELMRLRHNPYFDYMAGRVETFVLGER